MRVFFTVLILNCFQGQASQQEPATTVPVTGDSAANKLQALLASIREENEAWQKVADAARNRQGVTEAKPPVPRPDSGKQARKLIDFARANAHDPAAISAYEKALDILVRKHQDNRKAMEDILGTLNDKWARSEAIKIVFPRIKLYGMYCSNYEAFLRNVQANSPSREASAHAKYQLAELLNGLSHVKTIENEGPESREKLVKVLGVEQLDRVLVRNPDELKKECRELAVDVIDNYPDVNWWPSGGLAAKAQKNRPLKDFALEMLARDTDVAVGKKAPDLVGLNIQNNAPLKLSDYRGKVVVIVFWASWCAPCMSMIPDERRLVARFQDRQFALIGVNLDHERQKALEVMEQERMTWPSWFDVEGDIQESLKVKGQGIPRIFVIDHTGIIRHKDLRGPELESSVEKLLLAMPTH